MASKQLLEPSSEILSGSTPVSIPDDECCLTKGTTVASSSKTVERRWYIVLWNLTPCYLAVVSMVQVVMWLVADARMCWLLRWEPARRAQVWRMGSYMLLHRGVMHLAINVLLQNMFTLKYRKYRVFSVCVLAATDIAFCCMHARTESISVGAHWTGGVIGGLFGLIAYRGDPHRLLRVAAALVVLLLFVGSALALAVLPDSYFSR